MTYYSWIAIPLILIVSLTGCGDPIEQDIARLIEGGEAAEEAKMELNLAKTSAVIPLIEAFQNRAHPARARADLAQVLYRLYLREADKQILETLIAGLEDPDAPVRAIVARTLGDLRKGEAASPLIALLGREPDAVVRQEILVALESTGMERVESGADDVLGSEIKTGGITAAEHAHFTDLLVDTTRSDWPDSLHLKTWEWLEILAEEKTIEAQKQILQANLQEAEALLLAARDLVPDSKNIQQKLGRFYYDNGDIEKGLKILTEAGLATRVGRLVTRPQIDGVLEEPAWKAISPLTDLYQCIWKMRAYPIKGKAEIYLGYLGNNLYIAVKGYEPSTENLAAAYTQRDDGSISRDDCVEIFLDTNLDHRTYFQMIINSLGAINDKYKKENGGWEWDWNGGFNLVTKVEDTFWTIEIEIPADQLHQSKIQSGDIWGFNIARVRIANASEYGQWAPTYGDAHRPNRFGFLIFD